MAAGLTSAARAVGSIVEGGDTVVGRREVAALLEAAILVDKEVAAAITPKQSVEAFYRETALEELAAGFRMLSKELPKLRGKSPGPACVVFLFFLRTTWWCTARRQR